LELNGIDPRVARAADSLLVAGLIVQAGERPDYNTGKIMPRYRIAAAVHVKGYGAQVPAKPQLRDGARVKYDKGKVQYIAMLAWDTRAFSDAVVAAVRALVPDVFEADGGVT
jgi:hypothetical protein